MSPPKKIRPDLQEIQPRGKFRRFGRLGSLRFLFSWPAVPSESCAPGKRRARAKPSGPAAHGVELTILDKTCKPCEDFYHYASGEWLAKNPVPPAYPSWGRFNELAERNRELLHQILESAAANTQGDSRLE